MRSEALENIVTMLRGTVAGGDQQAMTIDDLRTGYDTMGQMLPAPDDATYEAADFGGVAGEIVTVPGGDPGRSIVYLHGGGYCIGSLRSHHAMVGHLARAAGARVLAVDYRLAPEHPAPAALDDALSAYRWALANGATSERTVIAGDSAGGGLTLATLVALRDAGLPRPAAGVLLSPWADLGQSGATLESKATEDPMVRAEDLERWSSLYRGDIATDDIRVSALFADLAGLPPLLIEVGTSEVLLDDARRVADRARSAGVDVTLTEGQDLIHVWHFFAGVAPESDEALDRVGRFVKERTGATAATGAGN